MKISVAMCTYNGERYLREQLDSIAAQMRPPDELVVCDDQSSDTTREIVADFAATAPFPVHLHVNQQNLGSTKNFERAIKLSEGDVIALSDQDDVWLPFKLQRLEVEFTRAPQVGLVFTDAEVIDDEGHPAGYSLWEKLPFDPTEREFMAAGGAFDSLLQGSTVTGATMAFRARFRELVLPIPNDLSLIHDSWIAVLIAAVANVLPITEPLVKYRHHAEQQIGAKERKTDGAAGLSGVKKAMRRTTSYREMIEIGSKVQQRLWERSDAYKSDVALSRLEARLKHLRARAHLPAKKLNRARCVIGELLSRRYHLYSNGFRSAVKDLLA